MKQTKKIPRQANYPLPADYYDLSGDGQRQARINGCRQWTLKGTQVERGSAFCACLRFFDLWYLWPDPDSDFEPMFYDMEPLPSPAAHYDMAYQWAIHRASLSIAPRGVGKTFDIRKAILLRMVSAQMYSILYATSSNDNAKATGLACKDQFENNQRLNDDWGPEFPKQRLWPRRGEKTFGVDYMQLMNGSWLRCISCESKQRGGRPRRYVLDDPEYDEKAATSMQLIRDYMNRLLFKVVMPMLMRPDCGVDWVATFVSRRHYAWFAMQTQQTKEGLHLAKDPRFNMWSRLKIRAAYEKEGELHSCWPEMWPVTREAKEKEGMWDRVSLEEIREMIGEPNFQAEYMANPGVGDDIFFPKLEEQRHGYTITPAAGEDPDMPAWNSQATLKWYSVSSEQWKEITLFNLVRRWRLFMTLDTSYTSGLDSDRKVYAVQAVNEENDLFLLDLWSDQCQEPMLIEESLISSDSWRVPVLWPETVKEGVSLYNGLYSMVSTRMVHDMGLDHVPAIKKLNPGRSDKTAKIAALLSRFSMGKIKLQLSNPSPPWRRLINQIDEFNPDAADGGLEKDDEIDTLSMGLYVLRGRLGRWADSGMDEGPSDPVERLKQGEVTDGRGLPIGMGVDWNRVSLEDIKAIFSMRMTEPDESRESKV